MTTGRARASLAVWCTVSRGEYPLLRHTMKNLLEHDEVRTVLVLHTGPAPPDDHGTLAARYPAVREMHRDFGEGYDTSVDEGGYDQLSARNFCLDVLEDSGAEWLMQFDADDYYESELVSVVAATDERYDVVTCSCHTLLSPTRFWYEPRLEKSRRGIRLLDPHTRIWRTSLGKRFELCPVASQRYVNVTRHCGVSFACHPHWRIRTLEERLHYHLHCLLGKRHAAVRTSGRELRAPLGPGLSDCLEEIRSQRHARGAASWT